MVNSALNISAVIVFWFSKKCKMAVF